MMHVTELYAFVKSTDESAGLIHAEREKIATLGLVGEIGSVLAALKKDMLAPPGGDFADRTLVKVELLEQIGDAVWYGIMLASLIDDPRAVDVFRLDIETLSKQLSGSKKADKRVQFELGSERCTEFIEKFGNIKNLDDMNLDEYQNTAYITRRTEGAELRNVCAAVLQQLAAQLSRDFLPNKEMALNHEVRPKDPVDALGEIMWHLSALAKLYDMTLSSILDITKKKSNFRNPQKLKGPVHDGDDPDECFPKNFEIHFVDGCDGSANMYWVENGIVVSKIGDSLTDNDHEGDGYRFHDVMHVAFAVFLRWSPNLRAFMRRKRKSSDATDRVEDGGRAKILEEAIILQIHLRAEAIVGSAKSSQSVSRLSEGVSESPYNNSDALNFEFLRSLHELCVGHEVYQNPKQDWESAIRFGYDCYYRLRAGSGGIIRADLDARNLEFIPLSDSKILTYPP